MKIKCRVEKIQSTFIIMKGLLTNIEFGIQKTDNNVLHLSGILARSRDLDNLGGYGNTKETLRDVSLQKNPENHIINNNVLP